jgi:hypothetical protein
MPKVEGSVTFHAAMSTAFPQPQPGKADSPRPMKVPADQLRSVLGITDVNYVSQPYRWPSPAHTCITHKPLRLEAKVKKGLERHEQETPFALNGCSPATISMSLFA